MGGRRGGARGARHAARAPPCRGAHLLWATIPFALACWAAAAAERAARAMQLERRIMHAMQLERRLAEVQSCCVATAMWRARAAAAKRAACVIQLTRRFAEAQSCAFPEGVLIFCCMTLCRGAIVHGARLHILTTTHSANHDVHRNHCLARLQAERSGSARQRVDARSGLGYLMASEDVVPLATMRVYSRLSRHRRLCSALTVCARCACCVSKLRLVPCLASLSGHHAAVSSILLVFMRGRYGMYVVRSWHHLKALFSV